MSKKQNGSSEAAVAEGQSTAVAAPLLSREQISAEIKPLSDNGFVAFFQSLWRAYLGWWYGFCDKHPKGSKIIYMLVFFFVFSNGVTIWQFLVMLFLPYAFQGIWDVSFCWPAIALPWVDAGGQALNYAIFNEPVKFMQDENVLLAWTAEQVEALMRSVDDGGSGLTPEMGGLGNFIAFEIAVFTAQCINLPLQRNITFKSHGNWVYQAMWYFIGWVGISIGVNALWGIMNPMMLWWQWSDVVITLIKTVVTGGISMAVFFPIFLVIFPNLEKVAKSKRAKVEKLKAAKANPEKIAMAELAAVIAEEAARLDTAEKEMSKSLTQSGTKAIACQSMKDKFVYNTNVSEYYFHVGYIEKAEKFAKKAKALEQRLPIAQQTASNAIADRVKFVGAYNAVRAEVAAARAARGEDVKGKKIAVA